MSALDQFSKTMNPTIFSWEISDAYYEIFYAGEGLPVNLYCTTTWPHGNFSGSPLGSFPTPSEAAEFAVKHANPSLALTDESG